MVTAATFDLCSATNFDTSSGAISLTTTSEVDYPPGVYELTVTGQVGSVPAATLPTTVTVTLVNLCEGCTLTL